MFTLKKNERFEQDIKKSRFLAWAGPVNTEEEARGFIAALSQRDAGHNCWAFRIGDLYRSNDDGEPGGTAGRPILQAIDGQSLDRVAVVVSRWFGGVLLGAGGLMRAYGGTAAACLQAAERQPIIAFATLSVTCAFADEARIRSGLGAFPAQDRVRDALRRKFLAHAFRLGGAFRAQPVIDRIGPERHALRARPVTQQKGKRHAVAAAGNGGRNAARRGALQAGAHRICEILR